MDTAHIALPTARRGLAVLAYGHPGAVERSQRAAVSPVLLPAVVALLGYGVVAQGAYYWPQASFFAAGTIAVALAATVAGVRSLIPAAVGMGALLAGLVASATANGWSESARIPFVTLIVAAGTLVAVHALVATGEREQLLEALSWIGAGVALVGLVGVAYHISPLAMRAQGIWRTSTTLTYSNAAGSLFSLVLGAPLLLIVRKPGPFPRVAAYLIMAGLATSLSRGGAAGAFVMILVALWLGGRPAVKAAIRPAIGAALASVALAASITGRPQPVLGLAGIAAGGLFAAMPFRANRAGSGTRLVALALCALAVVPVVKASHSRLIEARISPGSEDRLRTWRNSFTAALEHPVFGTGPGSFRIFEHYGGIVELTTYAHNEYLQTFAETGLVGLGSLALGIGVLAVWAWRRRPRGDERVVWAIAVGTCAAFAVHSTFDFVWRLPALPAIAFAWLAIAVTRPRSTTAPAFAARGGGE